MDDKKKYLGQVFTPDWIVREILDRLDYRGASILYKYVFEPGCGTGNFLYEIVQRYICAAEMKGLKKNIIKDHLEKYIYGIEVEPAAYSKCLARLSALAADHEIPTVNWKLIIGDILDIDTSILPAFDFVIGNPPYVRIHNLDKNRLADIKSKYVLCRKGIIDLFLVFFEIGITSLNMNGGKLGFITPNSYLRNSTYVDFRNFLLTKGYISQIVNFKSNKVFSDAATYPAITILDSKHTGKIFDYYEFDNGEFTLVNSIDLSKQDIKKWNFSSQNEADYLNHNSRSAFKISDFATVQYGFATLLDNAFILKSERGSMRLAIEPGIVYPIVKGSRYDGARVHDRIIYPYQFESGKWIPIPEKILADRFPRAYRHLLSNRIALEKRSLDKGANWYEYGRSQGIQTIHNEKIVISPIFKDEIRAFKVSKNVMVYSGMYLFLKDKRELSLDELLTMIRSQEFLRYARLVGKDMSGGYKTINTKAIKDFAAETANSQTSALFS